MFGVHIHSRHLVGVVRVSEAAGQCVEQQAAHDMAGVNEEGHGGVHLRNVPLINELFRKLCSSSRHWGMLNKTTRALSSLRFLLGDGAPSPEKKLFSEFNQFKQKTKRF
ncbi:hypothetical protein SRHO_G00041860 [Serrasalmus rhombeus]